MGALDFYLSAMLLNNTSSRRQSETGSFINRLGGKKGSNILPMFSGEITMPVSDAEINISSFSLSKRVVMLMMPSVPIAS